MSIESSIVHSGNYACEITGFGSGGYGYVSESINGVTTLCLETYFYLSADLATGTQLSYLLYALDGTTNYHMDLFRNSDGTYSWEVGEGGSSPYGSEGTSVALNTWHWIELDIVESATAGSLTAYFDNGYPIILRTGLSLSADPLVHRQE